MKRWFLVLISLLLVCGSAASAGTLFPSLAPSIPDSVEGAPSYGGYANVRPAKEEPYADGGTVVTYTGVSEQDYEGFGNYLAQLGFELVDSNVQGRVAEMIVANDQYSIGVVYNADTGDLQLIYGEGVEYAKMDIFKGYTRISLGETLKVPGLGEFTFTEFHLNNYSLRRATELFYGGIIGRVSNTSTALVFKYMNTTNQTKHYRSDAFAIGDVFYEGYNKRNDLADITLYYINDDGDYAYPSIFYGLLTSDLWLFADDETDIGVRQMATSLRCASFDVPQAVLNSTDGTLAVALEFHGTDVKAVLFLRYDGTRVGDWQ